MLNPANAGEKGIHLLTQGYTPANAGEKGINLLTQGILGWAFCALLLQAYSAHLLL